MRKFKGLIFLLILLIFTSIFFLFYKNLGGVWDGKNKVSLVTQKDESVIVSVFDPKLETVTNIKIPGNTEVEVSRQLGTWKLSSVWKLSENEGKIGELVSQTVTKNFKFPVFLWGDSIANGFGEGDLGSVLKAVFYRYRTNLKFLDRVRISMFMLGVKQGNKLYIDLSDTTLLKKTRLADGLEGYVVSPKGSEKLLNIFSDNEVAQMNLKMIIRDQGGKPKVAEEVASVIEVLGPKLVSITKEEREDFNCIVSGKIASFTKRVSRTLGCSIAEVSSLDNFDLEIKIGENFVKRF